MVHHHLMSGQSRRVLNSRVRPTVVMVNSNKFLFGFLTPEKALAIMKAVDETKCIAQPYECLQGMPAIHIAFKSEEYQKRFLKFLDKNKLYGEITDAPVVVSLPRRRRRLKRCGPSAKQQTTKKSYLLLRLIRQR